MLFNASSSNVYLVARPSGERGCLKFCSNSRRLFLFQRLHGWSGNHRRIFSSTSAIRRSWLVWRRELLSRSSSGTRSVRASSAGRRGRPLCQAGLKGSKGPSAPGMTSCEFGGMGVGCCMTQRSDSDGFWLFYSFRFPLDQFSFTQ